MTWLLESGVIVVAAVWMFVPGVLFAAAAGLRGLAMWALAPVASTAVLAVVAVLFGLAGIAWAPWTAGIAAVVIAGVAWGLRVLLPPTRTASSPTTGPGWVLPAGIGLGTVLAGLRLGLYIGAIDNVSQTNDAVFHLNALRYILDTGSASSLDIVGMLGTSGIYPAAWHAPASLIAMSTGADLAVVANALSVVIGALVWTSGIAWLTLVTTGGDRLAAGAAAALSAALAAFPLLMIQWGVLYPSLLAIALLPAALAVVVGLRARLRGSTRRWRDAAWAVLLIVVSLAAIALSQPSLLLAWGVVAVSFGVWFVIGAWRDATRRRRVIMLVLAIVGVGGFAVIWLAMILLVGAVWPHSRGHVEALLDIVLNGQVAFPVAIGVSILMIIGLVVCVRTPRLRWLATAWLAIAVLYYVSVAVGNPILRSIVDPFYNDPYRVAALFPLVVVPLAGIGVAWVARWAGTALRSRRAAGDGDTATSAWTLGVLAAFGIVSLVVAPLIQWRDVWFDLVDRTTKYDISNSSYLSIDERTLLERLPESVPPDALIVGNPSTGMAFGYALGDHSVYPLTWQPPRTTAYDTLASSLKYAATDPAVCPAIELIGARYVFDFGIGGRDAGRFALPGFTGLEGRDGFELVDREGRASLWRITACD